MSIPLPIWLPLGAALVSGAAFLWAWAWSWAFAREGEKLHPDGAWAMTWSAVTFLASCTLIVLGIWWVLGPL